MVRCKYSLPSSSFRVGNIMGISSIFSILMSYLFMNSKIPSSGISGGLPGAFSYCEGQPGSKYTGKS